MGGVDVAGGFKEGLEGWVALMWRAALKQWHSGWIYWWTDLGVGGFEVWCVG